MHQGIMQQTQNMDACSGVRGQGWEVKCEGKPVHKVQKRECGNWRVSVERKCDNPLPTLH